MHDSNLFMQLDVIPEPPARSLIRSSLVQSLGIHLAAGIALAVWISGSASELPALKGGAQTLWIDISGTRISSAKISPSETSPQQSAPTALAVSAAEPPPASAPATEAPHSEELPTEVKQAAAVAEDAARDKEPASDSPTQTADVSPGPVLVNSEEASKTSTLESSAPGSEQAGQGGTASEVSLQGYYVLQMRERIGAALEYPKSLQAQDIKGLAELRISLSNSGQVSRIELLRSSGKPELDRLAVAAVLRAQPYGPITRGFQVRLPVSFHLAERKVVQFRR